MGISFAKSLVFKKRQLRILLCSASLFEAVVQLLALLVLL